MDETFEALQKYHPERKETKLIGMIKPALDSVSRAIAQQSTDLFKSSYLLLTNTCNNCHLAANMAFNVVKIPNTQPFSDQDFKIN